MKKLLLLFLLLSNLYLGAQIPVVLPKNPKENPTIVKQQGNNLELIWQVDGGEQCKLVLDLQKDKPLISTMLRGKQNNLRKIASEVDPIFMLNVGKRTLEPEKGWTIFFDKVPTRPYKSYVLDIDKTDVKVSKKGKQTIVSLNGIKAPDFEGTLELTIYNGEPIFNIAAVVSTQKDSTAILYDAGLTGARPWTTVSFADTDDKFQTANTSAQDTSTNAAVKYRTIIGSNGQGSIAVFPPPHQYFYPLDEAFNLKFVWYGPHYRNMVSKYGIGIRQYPEGDNRFVPWVNAPPGTKQRLNFFCLIGNRGSEQLLDEVKKYTHNDKYPALPGYKTMASHFHNEFIMNVVLADKPVTDKPEFVDVFKTMGVDIVHLAEFHYTAHPKGPDDQRLKELAALFEQCRRLSDDQFLLLPGEEPNEFFGGHWLELFPKPVYWIMSRKTDKPFLSEDPEYGKVYRIGNKEEMLDLLEKENGLAWTAHPRIKGSTGYPDKYRDETFFKSPHFLGAAWKAMPADLSQPRLGTRVLDLMDDMNNWGDKKKVIAEADLFTITFENEMYAHMNVNYLKLDTLPKFDNGWQPVMDALSGAHFFSTTGEILIPSFTVNGKSSGETVELDHGGKTEVLVNLNWTFPLSFIEIVSGDGENVYREKIDLSHKEAFGSQNFEFTPDLENRKWVRLEVWDVAANGAFTQTVYLQDKD